MADDLYGGELPEDGLNEELDEGTGVTPADAATRQYEEAQVVSERQLSGEIRLLEGVNCPVGLAWHRSRGHPSPSKARCAAGHGFGGAPEK